MKKTIAYLSILSIIAVFCPLNRIFLNNMSAYAAGEQVTGLKARHYSGQTILTWTEIKSVCDLVPESMTLEELQDMRSQTANVRYRIYRSSSPITSVSGLEPIAEVPSLTGWNGEFYGDDFEGNKDNPALRYVVEADTDGVPGPVISKDTAVYAFNPDTAGSGYYAVTAVVDNTENPSVNGDNSLKDAVAEEVGQGIPILQRVEHPGEFLYVSEPTALYYYTRWESPPNASVHGKPFDYLVGLPPGYDPAKPAPVTLLLHCWGGSLTGGIPWWYNWKKGTILLSSNQIPYDWWTGYHELFYTGTYLPLDDDTNWKKGVVRPYSQNRILSFMEFIDTKWSVDKTRCSVSGMSMGGSGSIMMGIRHPESFAWVNSWVGVHIPAESPQFKGSYEGVYGRQEWEIPYEDGTPAFQYFDDEWYLRNHVAQDTPFITFSNGKNDSQIGWPQAVKFLRAMQDTRRPHIFVWGQKGHGQRAVMPMVEYGVQDETHNMIDMRIDQSMPAFTNCSLDDNPGNGDPSDGDEQGQINMYLFWDTRDIVDQPGQWEMTVGLINTAREDTCTVDITPRRLQQFKAEPGQVFSWSNISLASDTEVQSGQVTADSYGLVTLEGVKVEKRLAGKGGSRIIIKTLEEEAPSDPIMSPEDSEQNGSSTPQKGGWYIWALAGLAALTLVVFGAVTWMRRKK